MRCASYCTGDGYNLNKAMDHLQTIHVECQLYYNEVLYAKFPLESEEVTEQRYCEVLVFKYGCVVFWGSTHYDEKLILKRLAKYLTNPVKSLLTDSCQYLLMEGAETEIDEESDLITLGSDAPILKVSISYGLSQSVKLAFFEASVDNTIELTKKIPQELIDYGKISLTRKTLARKMGELFAVKNLINLHSAILDTPEFFWRKPKYEPYHVMTIAFLDLKTRIDILNKRVDVIHELYVMLSNEQQHLHSARLEWIIICLIMIEIILALCHLMQ